VFSDREKKKDSSFEEKTSNYAVGAVRNRNCKNHTTTAAAHCLLSGSMLQF
jgi:hypothetical protein